MKVAKMIFTILKLTPAKSISPRIHSQPTANGRNDTSANSSCPSESHRNTNTTSPQTKRI